MGEVAVIGARLRQARSAKNMTQADLADAIGISRSHLTNVERGRNGLRLDKLSLLAREIGTTVAWLIGDGGPAPEANASGLDREKMRHQVMVGRRLRSTIEAIGVSPADVARLLDVSPSKLGNWLAGRNYPTELLMIRFCDRYGVTMDWLYRGMFTGMPREIADKLWHVAHTERRPRNV